MDFNKELKNVEFKGLPKLNYEHIFHYEAKRNVFTPFQLNPIKYLIGLVVKAFFSPLRAYNYEENPQSKILFFKCHKNITSKSDKLIIQVSSLIPSDRLISYYNTKIKYTFNLCKGIYIIFNLIPSWYRSIQSSQISFKDKLFIIRHLVLLYNFWNYICSKKIKFEQYNLVVTLFDAQIFDSFIIELCKKKNIATATLQHGQFCANRHVKGVFEYSGIEFSASYSDYFLAWNKMTEVEALKEGMDKQKIIICGNPNFINYHIPPKNKIPTNQIFVIILSHPSQMDENITLIESANNLAKIIQSQYIIRLHPNFKGDEFDKIINKKYFYGFDEKGSNILTYTNKVKFSIIGSSSVFVDFIYINHPFIRLSTQKDDDKFKDIKDIAVFKTPNDIYKGYQTLQYNKLTETVQDYICGPRDVSRKYQLFFKRFL